MWVYERITSRRGFNGVGISCLQIEEVLMVWVYAV